MPVHVSLRDVTLRYPIIGADQKSFRSAMFSRSGNNIEKKNGRISVTALRGLSLDFQENDRVGLVGLNGAGKSTLLRVIGGIYLPSEGTVEVEGHVSCLFNYNMGMDPDDTGYENIRLIGMYFGMTPEEISERTDEIAEFTELGDFLRMPVRTYSSGMITRLSFAIATAIKPDILLLDEGFGTGDARFAERAVSRVTSLIDRTPIVVLASHSDDLIRDMCNQAVLLDHGTLVDRGDVDTILGRYHDLCEETQG